MAGMNAHLAAKGLPGFVLKRSDAYIGVLIDDLINKGTDEPYRMFTSRAEFRTLLRQDNADLRLTELSYRLGLASEERMMKVQRKQTQILEIKQIMQDFGVEPAEINPFFEAIQSSPIAEKYKAAKLLLRPHVELSHLLTAVPRLKTALSGFDDTALEQAAIQLKYDTYIEKEKELVAKMSQLEALEIPETFDYAKVAALSNEARQKFHKIRPRTLGQASRISGVNPSDVQILMVFMGR
jgi:tRNA uridine 5-carboxymethylaminomethyl modification enzyme